MVSKRALKHVLGEIRDASGLSLALFGGKGELLALSEGEGQLFEELEQRGWPARYEHPFHIGVTIGVHTGPTPIGVGLLRRENCPPESKKE